VRVSLRGINKVTKRLADGSIATFYYAWRGKGAPKLEGEPGSPEFIASFHAAHQKKRAEPKETIQALLDAYTQSPYFTEKAARTKSDYIKHIAKIQAEFGDFPVEALADRRARGEFLRWRDKLAASSRRQADYTLSVLALILAWAFDRGDAPINPLERPSKTYKANRSDLVWSDEDVEAFRAAAPAHLSLALDLALWTGQRQGDLLKLTWAAYDGESIRLRQGKTSRRVTIPVALPLRTALDEAKTKRKGLTILATAKGSPWTSDGFRTSWGRVAASMGGLTFHDLRGTAVTRLAQAGCSVPEIAAITGHALKEVETILDGHYLSRDSGLAVSAIAKLEKHTAGTKTANQTANRPGAQVVPSPTKSSKSKG
jgi:integrase